MNIILKLIGNISIFVFMILVTGGTGLLGSHLLYKLATANNSIRATFRSENQIKKAKKIFEYDTLKGGEYFEKIEWIKTDILDIPSLEIAFQGVSKVYHLAGMVSFSVSDSKMMHKVNFQGTANMVNLSLKYKIKKFAYTSSIVTLSQDKNSVDESCFWNPEEHHTPYDISKHLGEMEVWRGSQEGLSTVIVNPGIVLGSGHWDGVSSSFYKLVDKYKPPYFLPGSYGVVSAEDVVDILYKLMNSDITKERFVVVSENISFKDIQNIIATEFGIRLATKKCPKFLVKLGSYLGRIFKRFSQINPEAVELLYGVVNYDNSKIKKALNFEFISVEDTLKMICNKYISDKKIIRKFKTTTS